MLHSGNWLVPTLYGEPLLTKPPGTYIAIALVSRPFGGVSERSARLPSVLAALVLVLLFAQTFARELGRRAGLVAALVLSASLLWLDRVPSAEIDMLQVAWVGAALLCFLRALEASGGRDRASGGCEPPDSAAESGGSHPPLARTWWCAALVCVAGGVLTKWTAPAFFYLTVLPLLWWRGQLRLLLSRGHLLAVALGAAVCLAWIGAAAAQVGWDVWRETVTREAHTHLWPGAKDGSYAWAAVLLFPLRLLAGSLPWSAVALFALRPSFAALWDDSGRRLLQLFHCWTWPNLLLWSVIPTHALHHSLPLVPGLMGLAVMVWLTWFDGRLRWPLPICTPGSALAGLLLLWLAAKLAFVHAIVPERSRLRQTRQTGALLAARVPPNCPLYLCGVKDEGLLFYSGRPARRLRNLTLLPWTAEPLYCVMRETEWRQWHVSRPAQRLESFTDQQGTPLVLVRVGGTAHE